MLSVAFTALTTLVLVVCGLVSPPENLKVTCHNFHVVARWDHDEPGTTFVVTFVTWNEAEEERVEKHEPQKEREFDLSSAVRGSLDKLLDVHEVKVAAWRGDRHSENKSRTFSFSDLKTVDDKCQLDFPPVDTSVKNHKLVITFQNPLHFYAELKNAAESAVLHYVISSIKESSPCMKTQALCSDTVQLPDDWCVTLSDGFLYDDYNRSHAYIRFKPLEHVCADGSEDHMTVTLVVSLAVLVTIVTVLTLVICKVKAWTLKPSKMPNVLTPGAVFHTGWPPQDQTYDPVLTRPPSPEVLMDMDRRLPHHLPHEEDEERHAEQDSHHRPMVERQMDLGDGDQVAAYETTSELPEVLVDDSLESLKSECDNMAREGLEGEESQEEGALTVYDQPHCLVAERLVDLGDGEQVTAYEMTSDLPKVLASGVVFHLGRSDPVPTLDALTVIDGRLPDHPSNEQGQVEPDSPDDSMVCDYMESEESSPYDRPH